MEWTFLISPRTQAADLKKVSRLFLFLREMLVYILKPRYYKVQVNKYISEPFLDHFRIFFTLST